MSFKKSAALALAEGSLTVVRVKEVRASSQPQVEEKPVGTEEVLKKIVVLPTF